MACFFPNQDLKIIPNLVTFSLRTDQAESASSINSMLQMLSLLGNPNTGFGTENKLFILYSM